MKTVYSILLVSTLISCISYVEQVDIYGDYAPVNYINSYDTIQLKENGIYKRRVYDKNKKLILNMQGNWELINNTKIKLNSFYLNLDDDLKSFPKLTIDTTMELICSLKSENNAIQFCVGYYQGNNCYAKIHNP
jgi:hypothetical protein